MKNLKKQAINLRKRGWSYNVISERLGLSKSTLSDWLREIPYTPNQWVIARIQAGPAKAAAIKQKRRFKEITVLKKEGFRTIGRISRRDLLFLGIGIYMGEGSKLYEIIRVINSDPRIIRLAIEWFKNKDVRKIEVVTQGRNIPALRLYQKCGFQIQSLQIWYHKWF